MAGAAPIDAYLEAEGQNLVDRFNEDFGDATLMIVRAIGGVPDATAATVTGIDAEGIDAVASDPIGEHTSRVEFGVPVEEPDHLTVALIDLLERAREASGEDGQTAAEREVAALDGIGTHLTSVVAVEDLHPGLRQVTFGGGDLATTFHPVGPDAFFYLLVPPPGRSELGIDQTFTWEAHAQMPVEDRPVGAYYTVRRWRPEVAELDVLMVLHGDAHPGPASSWAARAQVGDPVALWGPRTSFHPPEGTDRLLLVADETGLPAVAGILEQAAPDLPITVIAEAASADERQALPDRPNTEVRWQFRDGAEAGTTTLLVDAVRTLEPFEGTPYVWGGGETKAMTAVRRHVRDERGLDRDAVALIAYWRHKATADDDLEPAG